MAAPSKALSNKLTNLASMLSDILDPTAPVGYNLLFSFGGFMCDVPTRLGVNEALDATSDAFVAAYVRFRAGRLEPDSQLLRKHGNALKALRSCLEVPSKAQASETLCALQLIMTYQVISSLPLTPDWSRRRKADTAFVVARHFWATAPASAMPAASRRS